MKGGGVLGDYSPFSLSKILPFSLFVVMHIPFLEGRTITSFKVSDTYFYF